MITIATGILLLAIVLVVGGYCFVSYYPPFGAKPSTVRVEQYRKSPAYSDGRFAYPVPTFTLSPGWANTISILREFVSGHPDRRPQKPLPVQKVDIAEVIRNQKGAGATRVTWMGHSAILVEINRKIILIDPMFSDNTSPVPFVGPKRFCAPLALDWEQLPQIDAVMISHDHYDHLDYGTTKQLRERVTRFIVPLGVGAHLERWGVNPAFISEHDWWEEFDWEGLRFACTPSRHFSGRGLRNQQKTLFCSWVIRGEQHTIFFSGDGGYGEHFKLIGERYGPVDVVLMECGQYDQRWKTIHNSPEEAVQAHLDLKGKWLIPVHWGAFTLAFHSWFDPAERAWQAAEEQGAFMVTPMMGQAVVIGAPGPPRSTWWRSLR